MVVMRLLGLACGEQTPIDGLYLKEYDPSRDGVDPLGIPMLAHIVCTPDPDEAMKFRSLVEVHRVWSMVDPRNPMRDDGCPNRPITAFHIALESYQCNWK